MREQWRRALPWLILAVLVVGLDQATKVWAEATLDLHRPVALAPYLNLTLTYNTGAAFSFLSDAGGWQRWFFVVISAVVSLGLVIWLLRLPVAGGWMLPLALALVLGGAVGNLWDRAILGHVVDFIDCYVGQWHWPAFNIADSAICVGAAFLVWLSLRGADAPGSPESDNGPRGMSSSKEL